ncbi:MAG TPA: FAD-binding protein, partial [Candidatus Binataceae bacterium]|nr:FAD-binding protein [Candidatus Binataceae bacterium]
MSELAVPSAYPDLTQAASQIVGRDHVRAPRESEAGAATLIAEPVSAEQISTLVRMCENDHVTLAPMGAARTLSLILRKPVVLGISLARMNRIIAHEPADMTVTVEAGITLGELNR